MKEDKLKIKTRSIVFVGSFNPTIIQPYWLALRGLISEEDAGSVKIDIMHEEIVRMHMDWLFIEVTKQRFELRTSQEPFFGMCKDLAMGIFRVLNETPIVMLGINHEFHYSYSNKKDYYDLGDKLANLRPWEKHLNDPRLLQIEVMEQKPHHRQYNGHYRVRVYSSEQIKQPNYGVGVAINDHYALLEDQTGRDNEIIEILNQNWVESGVKAENIVLTIGE